MISEQARVVAIDGDTAWVEADCQSACGSCAAKSGCGKRMIDEVSNKKRAHIQVSIADVPTVTEIGQMVTIAMPEQALLRGVCWAYILPLIAVITGSVIGNSTQFLGNADISAAVGAVLGLGFCVVFQRAYSRRNGEDARYQAYIVSTSLVEK